MKKEKEICEQCHYSVDLVSLTRTCYFCVCPVHRCDATFVLADEYQDCHMILAATPPLLVVCPGCLQGEL